MAEAPDPVERQGDEADDADEKSELKITIGEQRIPEMVSHRASGHGRRIHSTFEMGQGSGKARSRKRAQHWQRKQGGPKSEMVRRSCQASHLEQEIDGFLLFWEDRYPGYMFVSFCW